MSDPLERLSYRIQRAGGLPVFSRSLQEALDLIRTDAPMPAIAAAVERDPGLASRVLKLANSAYYGMRREVSTLKMAMVLLGVRSLRSMVLSIGVIEILGDDVDGSYVIADFAEHSFAAGRAASLLARVHRLPFGGEELVAGLVHDVGKLILLRAFPEAIADNARRFADLRGRELMEVEREVLAIDHPTAGAWAAREWHLPPEIADAIADHHAADIEPNELAAVAGAADLVAHWYRDHLDGDGTDWPCEWSDHPLLGHADLNADRVLAELAESEENIV